jgi:hypothetical protein
MINKKNNNANFEIVQYHQKKIIDLTNIIEKAYHAGMIAKYGKVIIFGTGAERGTFSQFANIHMKDIGFFNAKDSLTWFTNIYNKALRNNGKSMKKRNFYLSQLQEIDPLVNFFGLRDEFNALWNEVMLYDIQNNLGKEWIENGSIYDWKNRTMKKEITFVERQYAIMDKVVENMLQDNLIKTILKSVTHNPTALLQKAFIAGTSGLTLGQEDLETIVNSEQ